MDASITRRGQECWYRVKETGIKPVSSVGMIAINDAFMLEGAIYHLLKAHFKKESYYVDLLELFHEVSAIIARTHTPAYHRSVTYIRYSGRPRSSPKSGR